MWYDISFINIVIRWWYLTIWFEHISTSSVVVYSHVLLYFLGGYGSSDGLSPEVAKMASLTTSTYNGRFCLLLVFDASVKVVFSNFASFGIYVSFLSFSNNIKNNDAALCCHAVFMQLFFLMCCAVCLELTSRVCNRKRLIVCIQI